eukprot:GHVP01027914.1.p1 GENE.GHVP01027914.1~~GHVP01027914.1.p1  ORF type:complete len:191 (-),score=15.25 GHVP01027914.1:436-1008(-)
MSFSKYSVSDANILHESRRPKASYNVTSKKGGAVMTSLPPSTTKSGQRRFSGASPSPVRSGGLQRTPPRHVSGSGQAPIVHSPRPTPTMNNADEIMPAPIPNSPTPIPQKLSTSPTSPTIPIIPPDFSMNECLFSLQEDLLDDFDCPSMINIVSLQEDLLDDFDCPSMINIGVRTYLKIGVDKGLSFELD